MLHQVLYLSTSLTEMATTELDDILAVSRRNNPPRSITGLLMYAKGGFFQLLEGPREAVQDLYQTIEHDVRHRGIITMLDRPVEKRTFPDWAMGFRRDGDVSQLPQSFVVLSRECLSQLSTDQRDNAAISILETFLKTSLRF